MLLVKITVVSESEKRGIRALFDEKTKKAYFALK